MGLVRSAAAGLVACVLVVVCPRVHSAEQAEAEGGSAGLRQVSFGVGAAWLHPLRIADRISEDKLLSEFFAAWAPLGLPVALGAELAIGDQARFMVRPHLRLTAVREAPISLCLDGGPVWLATREGSAWGGGAGLSIELDVMDHLAVELRAACLLVSLPADSAAGLVAATSEPMPERGAGLLALPSVGLRVRAVF